MSTKRKPSEEGSLTNFVWAHPLSPKIYCDRATFRIEHCLKEFASVLCIVNLQLCPIKDDSFESHWLAVVFDDEAMKDIVNEGLVI
jgi:hypothetical protein